MNYSVKLYEPVNITLNYHETKSDAFKSLSNNTQALNFALIEEINENISLSYSSQHDVKNNYDPYKSSFKISIFDECSKLDLTYSNIRYNDNFNTNPKETIGIQFFMDYLGFFGYEQTTDLFFSEPGNVDYGT